MKNQYVIITCFEFVSVSVSENEFFNYINKLKESYELFSTEFDDVLNRESYYFIGKDGFKELVGSIYYD